jgi:hypothetical protein
MNDTKDVTRALLLASGSVYSHRDHMNVIMWSDKNTDRIRPDMNHKFPRARGMKVIDAVKKNVTDLFIEHRSGLALYNPKFWVVVQEDYSNRGHYRYAVWSR